MILKDGCPVEEHYVGTFQKMNQDENYFDKLLDDSSYFALEAETAIKNGQMQKAYDLWEKAMTSCSDEEIVKILQKKAKLLIETNRYKEAVEDYTLCTILEPTNSVHYLNKATLLKILDQKEKALETL